MYKLFLCDAWGRLAVCSLKVLTKLLHLRCVSLRLMQLLVYVPMPTYMHAFTHASWMYDNHTLHMLFPLFTACANKCCVLCTRANCIYKQFLAGVRGSFLVCSVLALPFFDAF